MRTRATTPITEGAPTTGAPTPAPLAPLSEAAKQLAYFAADSDARGLAGWAEVFRKLARSVTAAATDYAFNPTPPVPPLSLIERGALNRAQRPTYSELDVLQGLVDEGLPIGPDAAGRLVAEVRRLRTLTSSLYRQLDGEVD